MTTPKQPPQQPRERGNNHCHAEKTLHGLTICSAREQTERWDVLSFLPIAEQERATITRDPLCRRTNSRARRGDFASRPCSQRHVGSHRRAMTITIYGEYQKARAPLGIIVKREWLGSTSQESLRNSINHPGWDTAKTDREIANFSVFTWGLKMSACIYRCLSQRKLKFSRLKRMFVTWRRLSREVVLVEEKATEHSDSGIASPTVFDSAGGAALEVIRLCD